MGGVGEVAADGKGAGASATRTFGDFWLDAQVQATGPKAKIDSAASGKLENDATGKSRALGLEAGRRMPIAGGAFLTPRLGFSWTSADLDDFTDSIRPNPTRVSVEKARSVRGRAGITLAAPAGDGRAGGARRPPAETPSGAAATRRRWRTARPSALPPDSAFALEPAAGAPEARTGVG